MLLRRSPAQSVTDKNDLLVRDAPQRPARPPSGGPGAYLVEVTLKPEFPDAEGICALSLLHATGLPAARCVRLGRLYDLRGPLNLSHVHIAVRELLCDGVTQNFRIGRPAPSSNGGSLWRVEVWPKTAAVRADALLLALQELGLPPAISVRCGRLYHITGKCGHLQLEKAVARSLAHPLTHTFSVCETA